MTVSDEIRDETRDGTGGFRDRARAWLAGNVPAGPFPPDQVLRVAKEFQAALFDAGFAGITWPKEVGGQGLGPAHQQVFSEEAAELDLPTYPLTIGMGMCGPTLVDLGTPEQKRRYLPKLLRGEEVWCQLFSEPGAGSDLAALGTRAVRDGDDWIVTGQKVWTSGAHESQWAILVTRTDPDVPKHQGMTYFLCDMTAPGVEVRPLRQITGEAEFNEVFLTDVRIPDSMRLGDVGDGWTVAQTTLMNERVSIGGGPLPREGGMISVLAKAWRDRPDLRTAGLQDALLKHWVAAEAARLAGERLRQSLAAGQPGPEGSAQKLTFARLNQEMTSLELELNPEGALRYEEWTMRRPTGVDFVGRSPGFRYLRAKGNSIEGGTSEILRNIVAERVLGLPTEKRVDVDVPWKDLAK